MDFVQYAELVSFKQLSTGRHILIPE